MSLAGVGKISASKEQLNAVVPITITSVIRERATSLSMTKGRYASHIVQWWFQQGCPPVTRADEAIQQLAELQMVAESKPKGKK